MKKIVIALVIIATGFMMFSCIYEAITRRRRSNRRRDGAIAGQIIGNDTASTLIGAAVGGLVGAVGGNAVDQSVANQRMEARQQQTTAAVVPQYTQEAPPGRWVEVPGQWAGGKWVPAHNVWVPVNP